MTAITTRRALALLILPATLLLGSCRAAYDRDAWLAAAGLGPHLNPAEPLAAIEAKAKQEGRVVVWSLSSRLEETGKEFEKKYGIPCDVQAMGTQDLIKKVRYDQKAGGFNADVYLFGDAPEVLSTIVVQGAVVPWYDEELQKAIPAELMKGLPTHHVSAVGLIYNSEKYDHPPIKSWWELTLPEWHGRVVMKDLKKGGGDLNLFTAFTKHAEDLAKDYEATFGKPLELQGTDNAGYEYLRRLLANKPIFTAAGSEAADKVGASNVANPPVGLMTIGKVRYKGERSLNLKWMPGITPASGLAYPDPIGIANGAKHPNAAKLFIHFAMSLDGYKPYIEYGTWPARTDIPLADEMIPLKDAGFWLVDPEYNFKERKQLLDFIIRHQ